MSDMDSLLSLPAVIFGIAHAVYVYRREVTEFRSALRNHSIEVRFRASYYALWTLVLWVVLGPYIVGYWLLAIIPYLLARAMGKTFSIRAGAAEA